MHPDEVSRKENIKRAFSGSRAEIEENDMKAYLASSDSEGDDDEPEPVADGEPKLSKKELARQKMREALGLCAESASKSSKSAPVGEMEMTFGMGDEDAEKQDPPADKEETTVEKYMRKEREKKARKKEKSMAKREGAEKSTAAKEDKAAGDDEDLGFDDPFFTTDEPVKATKSSQRKEERLKKRELKEAESKKNAAERANLERIMAEDAGEAVEHLDHFDMNEIARAEKQKLKKGKKRQKDMKDRGGLQEDFQMDVDDDRFKAVFESHEFAIDPSNPKFKATPGMKQLLEEGRKKRNHGEDAPSRDKKKTRRR
jgi:hypothetical protein